MTRASWPARSVGSRYGFFLPISACRRQDFASIERDLPTDGVVGVDGDLSGWPITTLQLHDSFLFGEPAMRSELGEAS